MTPILFSRVELDVTNKSSISKAASKIKAEHGKLDILVNKSALVQFECILLFTTVPTNSAGAVGPMSQFIGDRQAPENASAQSLGDALFASESFEQWSDLLNANVSTVFFVTAALLGLLAEGAKGRPGSGSSVINIGSVAAITKLNQTHVTPFLPLLPYRRWPHFPLFSSATMRARLPCTT